MIRVVLWRILATISMTLALIGIPLPGLPTVPFVILSAWAAGKGWPEFERWLLHHPRYGPSINEWRKYGAVSKKAKYLASLMMLLSTTLLWLSTAPTLIKLIVSVTLIGTSVWLWLRPESQA